MKKILMEGEEPGVFYKADEVEQLKKEFCHLETTYAELKLLAANRKAFIDWCAENHEEILKEYTGFLEEQK